MLDASPTKLSATGVTLNTSTRKGGGLKQAKKQMQVSCLAVFLGEGCQRVCCLRSILCFRSSSDYSSERMSWASAGGG